VGHSGNPQVTHYILVLRNILSYKGSSPCTYILSPGWCDWPMSHDKCLRREECVPYPSWCRKQG
jgi:hypothetical protein